MYNVALTLKSRNGKTGDMPVSTTTRAACPDSCPLKKKGCYAANGPLGMYWQKVTDGRVGMSWDDFVAMIDALVDDTLWRHNQAGDLPGDGRKIDGPALKALVKANRGKRGFTYTHYPMTAGNLRAVKAANAAGFTINLSANNLAQADSLAETGAGPVVVVLPASVNGPEKIATPAGRKVVVCPATYRDDINCKSCGLCQRQREAIVGFPAHGVSARAADAIARGA